MGMGIKDRTTQYFRLLFGSQDDAASKQSLPLGISRGTLLFFYCILNFFCGWAFFNWASVSSLLFEDGAYMWTCAKDSMGNYINDLRQSGKPFICDQQDVSVQFLFLMQTVGHIAASPLIGIGTDHFGIRITILVGMLSLFIGSILLGFSTYQFPAYALSLFIIGGAGDVLFVPTMRLTRIYPSSAAFVSAILGSTVSASPAISSFLYGIKHLFNNVPGGTIILYYAFLIVFPLTIVAFLLSPKILYTNEELMADSKNLGKHIEDAEAIAETEKADQVEPQTKAPSTFVGNAFSVRTAYIFAFAVGYSIVMMLYQCAAARQLKPEALHLLEVILPFSWIPCLVYGKITDKLGIQYSLILVNTTGILTVLTFMSNNAWIQCISTILFTIYVSFLDVACYCYCDVVINPSHLGKIYGGVVASSGLVSIGAYYVYEKIIVLHFQGQIHQTFMILLGILGLIMVPLFHLLSVINKWTAIKS